jgi:hypothetical protein
MLFQCDRDRRFAPVDHRRGARGTVNRRLRREAIDRAPRSGALIHRDKPAITVAVKHQDVALVIILNLLDALTAKAETLGWDGCRHGQTPFCLVEEPVLKRICRRQSPLF